MIVVLLADDKAMHVQASPFVYTQPKENGLYSLEALFLNIDAANEDTVLILPDGTEIAEGDEITDDLRALSKPFSDFERATKEQAQADVLGLLLRNSVAEGGVTDDELLRIAPAFTDREWRPGLAVEVGDIYAHEGYIWRCVAAHTTQSDWRPNLVPALWRKIERTEPDTPRIWQSQTDYVVDDVVYYPDADSPAYRCIQGHTSQDGWEPPNVPALWALEASMDMRKEDALPE
ncbi:hypothetical protein LJC74_08855 [Eubacteriales bacterium OttesenSCG-928-A19]|nr:hypothetical protein [Eubacteriales bacterium OttesenSCG-928-A19]